MTDYTHIRIPVSLHRELKTLSQQRDLPLHKLISELVNTMLTRNSELASNQTIQNQTAFSDMSQNEAGPVGFEPTTTDSGGQRHVLVISAFSWV